MNSKKQNGFTLIELMIVIAIIAILAAIALPAYQDYIGRSQMSEAMVLSDGAKTAVAEYFSQNNACPDNTAAAPANGGLAAPTSIFGKYVAQVAVNGAAPACTITATMKTTNVAQGIIGGTLTLKMANAAADGTYQWACTSGVKQKYLPSSCTGT